MATKAQNTPKKTETAIAQSAAPADATTRTREGVRQYKRLRIRDSLPEAALRLRISVQTDILDRYEGKTNVETLWGERRNDRYIARALKDDSVRKEVTSVFLSRLLIPALTHVIAMPSLKVAETPFSKLEFVKEMTSFFLTGIPDRVKPLSQMAINAVLELIMPELIRINFVSSNGAYTQSVTYGFGRVTTRDIRDVVTLSEVQTALLQIKLNVPLTRMSRGVFAEKVADAFRPIGVALSQTQEIDTVLDDILVGISAVLDPDAMTRNGGVTIPAMWRNNAVVDELSKCLPFVRAALSLPHAVRGLSNDTSNRERWAAAILESLRGSDRYYIATRERALEHYGVQRVIDGYGKPVSAIAYRAVEAVPVGQAVIATPDAVFTSQAWDIGGTSDRIAEALKRAYGSARFSTESAAGLLHATMMDIASLGYNDDLPAFLLDAAGFGYTMSDLAVLRADELYVETAPDGVVMRASERAQVVTGSTAAEEADWEPAWWFRVSSPDRQAEVFSGTHFGDVLLTSDPFEVMISMPDLLPRSTMPARPQLLEEAAFNTRLMRYDAEELIRRVTARFELTVTFSGKSYNTAFRTQDFASLRAVDITSIVVPQYNKSVIETFEGVFGAVDDLVNVVAAAPAESWKFGEAAPALSVDVLRSRVARSLIYTSQKLDPVFRDDVQKLLVSRVIMTSGATGVQQQLMRAQMLQQPFTATSDVVALLFLMFMQGIDTPFWTTNILRSDEFARAVVTIEADRVPTDRV